MEIINDKNEFVEEEDLQEKFIAEMKAKGFELKVFGENTYLSRGMETFQLYNDGLLGYSSPRGNSKYKSLQDWYDNKKSLYEEYSLRD